jgi:hypothetical protein
VVAVLLIVLELQVQEVQVAKVVLEVLFKIPKAVMLFHLARAVEAVLVEVIQVVEMDMLA